MIGFSFAWYSYTSNGTKRQVITASNLLVELEEDEALVIENALPMYDEVGKIQQDYFSFRLINRSDYDVDYVLHLADITEEGKEKLNYEDVKYYLTKKDTEYYQKRLSERTDDIIDEGRIKGKETIPYTLRFWIRDGVIKNEEIAGKTLKFKLIIDATNDTRERYQITYDTGLEGVTIDSDIKIEGEDFTLPNTKLEKEEYIFLGWSTTPNSDKAEYAPGAVYRENAITHFYAVWVKATYIIHYDANTGSNPPADQTKKYGEEMQLTNAIPEKPGHSFKGWSTSPSGGVEYQAGDTITKDENLNLYAIWQVDTYTITYNANGGSGAPTSQTKTYDIDITLSTTVPTRTNYIFLGWSEDKNATTATYKAGATYKKEGNTTLYAIWKLNAYTVTYNYAYNGGTSATKTQQQVVVGNAIDLTPTAAKSGYTFIGWNTSATATTGLSSLKMGNSAVTLYAIYRKTITVTYRDGQGTTSSSVYAYNKATSASIKLATPRSYTDNCVGPQWSALGWSTGTTASSSINYSSGQTITISSNLKLYGQYKKDIHIAYSGNGGSCTRSQSSSYTVYHNGNGATTTANMHLDVDFTCSRSGKTWNRSMACEGSSLKIRDYIDYYVGERSCSLICEAEWQ